MKKLETRSGLEHSHHAQKRYGVPVALVLSLLMISLSAIILASCDNAPEPGFSPLALDGSEAIYMAFLLPDYWKGEAYTGTVTLTRELRVEEDTLATRVTEWEQQIPGEMLPEFGFEPTWPVKLTEPAFEYWKTILEVETVGMFGLPVMLEFEGQGYDSEMRPIEAEDGMYKMIEIGVEQIFLPFVNN